VCFDPEDGTLGSLRTTHRALQKQTRFGENIKTKGGGEVLQMDGENYTMRRIIDDKIKEVGNGGI
jgi:hypothetical protein